MAAQPGPETPKRPPVVPDDDSGKKRRRKVELEAAMQRPLSEFVEGERELPYDKLKVDKMQRQGQVNFQSSCSVCMTLQCQCIEMCF
jgi:hypothetical protein